MVEILESKFKHALRDIVPTTIDLTRLNSMHVMIALFIKMFDEIPHSVSTLDNEDDTEIDREEDYRNALKTLETKYKDECISCNIFGEKLLIFDGLIISSDDVSIYGVSKIPELPKFVTDNIVYSEPDKFKTMSYVTSSGNGFNTMQMKVTEMNCDLNLNYNADLPYDKLEEFVSSNESGLVILFGNVGTGKTSVLRHLIYNTSANFIFLDSSCFNYITDASFIRLLANNKDSVVVLEDSEELLRDRVASGNSRLSALLNLSDGILGDSLNLKFICTFNADLKFIDKAVTRKGRLKLKYEFKALTADKTQLLAKSLGKDIPEGMSLPLCEIYNYGEDNGVQAKRSVGF